MQPHCDFLQRPLLAPGIELERHRSTRAQRGEQIRVRIRTGVRSAGLTRFIGDQLMGSGRDLLLEEPRRRNDYLRHKKTPTENQSSESLFPLEATRSRFEGL